MYDIRTPKEQCNDDEKGGATGGGRLFNLRTRWFCFIVIFFLALDTNRKKYFIFFPVWLPKKKKKSLTAPFRKNTRRGGGENSKYIYKPSFVPTKIYFRSLRTLFFIFFACKTRITRRYDAHMQTTRRNTIVKSVISIGRRIDDTKHQFYNNSYDLFTFSVTVHTCMVSVIQNRLLSATFRFDKKNCFRAVSAKRWLFSHNHNNR